MKQLFVGSTFFQCLSLAAAVDAGVLPGADERILVLADSSQAPELTVPLQDQRGFAAVASRFDRVVDLGALVYPRRAVQFSPRAEERHTWERLLRSHWDLGSAPVQLFLDSVQVNPSLALAAIFAEAELFAHSDGLMTYAPTRRALPLALGQRLAGLVHLDLVPGLRPQLLAEHGVPHRVVALDALGTVLDEICAVAPLAGTRADRPTALVMGQYLSSLRVLTPAEETDLNRSMIIEAGRLGAEVCLFKPHPSAPPTMEIELRATAREAALELVVDTGAEIAELTMGRHRPRWVLSCFSTGLATARYLLGLEARAVGTSALLPRLAPYENSNRVPLVLAEALFHRTDFTAPALAGPAAEGPRPAPSRDLQQLVETVAYCMQPTLHPELAAGAAAYLELVAQEPDLLALFFKRKRLTLLDLPGALPRRRRLLGQRWTHPVSFL